MNRRIKNFGIVGFISTLCGFVAKAFYRDYVTMNKINDSGIAGFLPSYFYVLGFSQLLLIRETKYPISVILIVTLASTGFEFMQYHSSGLLDIPDIVASVFGGITSLISLKIVQAKSNVT